MELKCAFVLVLVNIVTAHGYGIKGGGATAQAAARAVANSGVGAIPLAVPVAGGFSGSFSKSSSSSFASSSSSSSSSSFSYSGSGVSGLKSAGENGIAFSGEGHCGTGACQDVPSGLKESDIESNRLQAHDGTETGAKAFSGSTAYSQNGGQTPCPGEKCSTQGSAISGSNANSLSGSSGYSQNGLPCTGESCSVQGALSDSQANSFSGSSANSQNRDQTLCKGENCSSQGGPKTEPNYFSGSSTYFPNLGQEPCLGATCTAQGDIIADVKENTSIGSSAHLQNENNTPCAGNDCTLEKKHDCVGSNCNKNSNTVKDCALGFCGPHTNQKTETTSDSNDQSSKYDGSAIHFKPDITSETKNMPNSSTAKQNTASTYGSSDQSSKYEGISNGYGSVSGCSNGNCGLPVPSPQSKPTNTYNNPASQYSSTLTSGAEVPIPVTYLTTPKETPTVCTTPGCETPEVGKYPGTENLPSSYGVPIYPTEIKNPSTSFGNKDACTSGNCENYPLNDGKIWPNNLKADSVYEQPPVKTEQKDYTGPKCTSPNCDASTSDIDEPKSLSTSYTTQQLQSANDASHLLIPMPTVDSFKKAGSQLPTYTTVPLSGQPHKPDSFPLTSGEPNCALGNCAGHPTSPAFTGTGSSYSVSSNIPSSSQGSLSYNLAGHTSPTSCTGLNCAKYPSNQPDSFPLTSGESNCAPGNCAGLPSPTFTGTGSSYSGSAKISTPTQGSPSHNLAGHTSPTSCTGLNCAKYPSNQPDSFPWTNGESNCASGNCAGLPPSPAFTGTGSSYSGSAKIPTPTQSSPSHNLAGHTSPTSCTGLNCAKYPSNQPDSFSLTGGDSNCASGNCAGHPSSPAFTGTGSSYFSSAKIPSPSQGSPSYNLAGHTSPTSCTGLNCAKYPSNQPDSFPLTGGESNCASGNCAGHPSSPAFTVTSSSYSGSAKIPSSSQGYLSYNLAGHISPTSCTGFNCAKYPLNQFNEPAPTRNPGYSFTTLPLHNSPSQSLGTTLPSHTVPSVIYSHGTQPPHQNLPTSTGIGFPPKPSQVNSLHHEKVTSDGASNEKLPVYNGGFGGPSGFLSPNDFTVPSKPLAPQQRPTVKPIYPYDGSLAPTVSSTNIPVSTSQKVPCTSGICGSSPTLSIGHFGHIGSGSAATAAAHSESKEVAYTGGFGGPPGFLAPFDSNKKIEGLGHSGLNTKRPQPGTYPSVSLPVGNVHSSYGGTFIGSGATTKPIANAQIPSSTNPLYGGYKGQNSLETTSRGCNGGNCGLNRPSYGGSSHFGQNINNLPNPRQPNQYSGSQPNSKHDILLSGSESQLNTGTIAGAAASANSAAYSGSKTKPNAGGCGSSDCSANGDTSLHDHGNVDSGLSTGSAPSATGVLTSATAQSGAFAGAVGEGITHGNEKQLGGCSGGCNSHGGSLGGGNGLYGAGAIAKSAASTTSGVIADQLGLGRSFTNSFATAHASSGSAVKGGYGKR